MRKLIISVLVTLMLATISTSCVSTRKYDRILEGLMIQDNTRLRINRAYYSHHNMKIRKDAHRKFKKYGRR